MASNVGDDARLEATDRISGERSDLRPFFPPFLLRHPDTHVFRPTISPLRFTLPLLRFVRHLSRIQRGIFPAAMERSGLAARCSASLDSESILASNVAKFYARYGSLPVIGALLVGDLLTAAR